MISEELNKIQSKSKINYNYQTIRITKSRIEKGLLAIPISMMKLFPQSNTPIKLFLDDSNVSQLKNFSSFKSSTKESRIGGLRDWLNKHRIKDGDEIVIQVIDKTNFVYRLIPEKLFISRICDFQTVFDEVMEEEEVNKNLEKLQILTQMEKTVIYLNEYYRICKNKDIIPRKRIKLKPSDIYENTPNNIRVLLGNLHRGLCQVCRFTFLKKDRTPYFEIHHLNPNLGHHPKNLILVCANCHRQFEYADIETYMNENGWLIEVKFNDQNFMINQPILNENYLEFKKTIYF